MSYAELRVRRRTQRPLSRHEPRWFRTDSYIYWAEKGQGHPMTKTVFTLRFDRCMRKVAAITFLSTVLAVPVASAQNWNGGYDQWGNSPGYGVPLPPPYRSPSPQSDDPAFDKFQAEMDRDQARRTMRALELRAQQEMMGAHAYSACGSITNNPAAREECRRNRAPW